MIETTHKAIMPVVGIPSADAVDYGDGTSISGYAHLLVSAYRFCGGFSGGISRDSHHLKNIEAAGRRWIGNVADKTVSLPVHELPTAMTLLDIVYRIAYRRPAPARMIRECDDRVISAWLRGERRISEHDIFIRIRRKITGDFRIATDGELGWYSSTIDAWNKALRQGLMPLRCALLCAGTLLSDNNIPKEMLPIASRRTIAMKYRPYLDETGPLGGDELKALHAFAISLSPEYISIAAFGKYERKILSSLADSRDLDPLDRRAYALDRQILSRISG